MVNRPEEAQRIQGSDPKGEVFAHLSPVLYAAESPISGVYEEQSLITATQADAHYPLRGSRVLDLGCGYGTTTAQLMRCQPREIVAIDNSSAMTDLMKRVLLSSDHLESWLTNIGAREVLGEFFKKTLAHLEHRRADFQEGIFRRNGGKLFIKTLSALDVSLLEIGEVNVVVANNVLHWPVNQQRKALEEQFPGDSFISITERATRRVLQEIRMVLKKGGILEITEPKDFVTLGDPHREADAEKWSLVNNPVYIRFNQIFNRLLLERFGIKREVPKTSPLFPMEDFIASWCHEEGFECLRVTQIENRAHVDPIDYFYVRMPMWIGGVNVSFSDKIALIQAVVSEARETISLSERLAAIPTSQSFCFCLKSV